MTECLPRTTDRTPWCLCTGDTAQPETELASPVREHVRTEGVRLSACVRDTLPSHLRVNLTRIRPPGRRRRAGRGGVRQVEGLKAQRPFSR